MTGEYLTAPGLLAHVFLGEAGRDAEASWERLRSVWRDVTGGLGLDRPILPLAVPSELQRHVVVPADGTGLLTAAERGDASVWQASAWADHDLLCVTVMMAPERDADCARAWADLESSWREAVAALGPDGVLGEARIFLGLASRGAVNLVRAAAPGPSAVGWWQHWDAVPLGSADGEPNEVLMWETGPDMSDGRVLRRLIAVTPAESERRADRLLWTNGDGRPAPLARHLMHAARLRHQVRVFRDGAPSRQLRDELACLVDEACGTRDPAGDLARLRRAQAAAGILRTRVAAMREAVGIIGGNMRLALELPAAADAAVGPLSEDRYLAAWFGQRLDDEIGRLDAAVANVRRAMDLMPGPPRAVARVGPPGWAAAAPAPRDPWGPHHRTGSDGPWVVVFTAIEAEYNAVRQHLGGPVREHVERGTLYEVGTLPGIRGSWRVAIAQTGQGSTMAGLQLDRAVHAFRPEVALFLGTAGGRKDVALGDVVAAEAIYDYESGKSTLEGFQPRPRTRYPSWGLLQRARLVARAGRWQARILPGCPHPPPASFVKPIVTGGKVIAHDRSEVALMLGQYASDAVAVEMEGHGFLEGAYLNAGLHALVIRGISDLLAGKDSLSDDRWQPVASRHAAAFAMELLDSIGQARG